MPIVSRSLISRSWVLIPSHASTNTLVPCALIPPGRRGLTADEFNTRLFAHNAAILPGALCDMFRRGNGTGGFSNFIRFSFGPLPFEVFERDAAVLKAVLGA